MRLPRLSRCGASPNCVQRAVRTCGDFLSWAHTVLPSARVCGFWALLIGTTTRVLETLGSLSPTLALMAVTPTEVASPLREAVPSIVQDIVRAVDPVRIILFGSVVRGDDGPDSDLDFLVVLESFEAATKGPSKGGRSVGRFVPATRSTSLSPTRVNASVAATLSGRCTIGPCVGVRWSTSELPDSNAEEAHRWLEQAGGATASKANRCLHRVA